MRPLVVVIIVIFVYRGNSPTNDVIGFVRPRNIGDQIALIQVNFGPFDEFLGDVH